MFAAGVVEAIDVLKEGIGHLLSCGPSVSPDQFGLEGFEEGLDDGVVVAVSLATHRYLEAHFPQPFLIVMGTILTASILVMNAALWRGCEAPQHCSEPACQVMFQTIADGPTHNTAVVKVKHHCQVQPALSCPDIGDVGRPLLIWLISMEVPVKPVGRNVEVMIAVSGRFVFTGSDDAKAVQTHQTTHATLTNPQTYFFQLLSHARAAIAAKAQVMLFTDMGQQHHVVTLTFADRSLTPSPEAA